MPRPFGANSVRDRRLSAGRGGGGDRGGVAGTLRAHRIGEDSDRRHAAAGPESIGAGGQENNLAGVHPCLRHEASDRLSLWGVPGSLPE